MEFDSSYLININKGKKTILRAQVLMTVFIFITEIVCNYILYATRSQGYGPDTIVIKLLRYLVHTTAINLLALLLTRLCLRLIKNALFQQYSLLFFTSVLISNVCTSHYQFMATFAAFTIPIILSTLFENKRLSVATLITCLVLMLPGIIHKANDPAYSKDIAPDMAIVISLCFAVFSLSGIQINALIDRRNDLASALVAQQQAELAEAQNKMSLQMLETLAKTIDAKDRYTNGHSMRVAAYSVKLATEMGMEAEEIETLKYEALLHDIGKIGIPDSVLNKPGKLSDEEFGIIKTHTTIGDGILKDMISIPGASRVARSHHERYDGKGYPDSISESNIPLNSRIVCIADAYDAMSSDRVYRKALSRERILEELTKGRGTQFDPELLDTFILLLQRNELAECVSEEILESTFINPILKDIESLMNRLSDKTEKKDFSSFYEYMDKLGKRYNRSVEIIAFDILPAGINELTQEQLFDASTFIELAARKNIRGVDVYSRYSETRHLIILLDAGEKNIDAIAKRILADFNQLADTSLYTITCNLIGQGGREHINRDIM